MSNKNNDSLPDRERGEKEGTGMSPPGVSPTSSINQNHDDSENTLNGTNGDPLAMQHLTVEELYDKEKYDLSTMEPEDVFVVLQ